MEFEHGGLVDIDYDASIRMSPHLSIRSAT